MISAFPGHLGHSRNSAQDVRVIAGRQTAQGRVAMAAQDRDHDKARELAEKALDKLVEGDEAAGDKLIKQAEKIDEVAEDLDISDEDIEQAQDSAKSDAQK
jgi:predicted transposase YdaD